MTVSLLICTCGPAGSQEDSARGQVDPVAAATAADAAEEKAKQQQKPAFRFPSQQEYYARVPFHGNPYAGKGPGGQSAPLFDPAVMGPMPAVSPCPIGMQ